MVLKADGQVKSEHLLKLTLSSYLVTCDDRLVRQGQRLREQGVLSVTVINPVDLVQEV